MKPSLFLKLIPVLLLLALPHSALADEDSDAEIGGDFGAGNGGDVVNCRPYAKNPLKGDYVLDHAATYSAKGPKLVEVKSWAESVTRISGLLKQKSPYLSKSLNEFLAYTSNTEDKSAPRLWEPAEFGLIDVKDERLTRDVPPNCRTLTPTGALKVRQAVIRTKTPGQVIYEYDQKILDSLLAKRPLEYSHLMIHEWLWDLTDNVRIIRKMNKILHSEELESLGGTDLTNKLVQWGLLQKPRITPGTYAQDRSRYYDGFSGGRCAVRIREVNEDGTRFTFDFTVAPHIRVGPHDSSTEHCEYADRAPRTMECRLLNTGAMRCRDNQNMWVMQVESPTKLLFHRWYGGFYSDVLTYGDWVPFNLN